MTREVIAGLAASRDNGFVCETHPGSSRKKEAMALFRVLLVVLFTCIVGYTAVVVVDHGFGLFPIFFGDIQKMGWPGQFNVDFTGFLVLSGFWLAWRNDFSAFGIALGVLGFFGGAPVLTAYLFFASLRANGDVKELLLGTTRSRS